MIPSEPASSASHLDRWFLAIQLMMVFTPLVNPLNLRCTQRVKSTTAISSLKNQNSFEKLWELSFHSLGGAFKVLRESLLQTLKHYQNLHLFGFISDLCPLRNPSFTSQIPPFASHYHLKTKVDAEDRLRDELVFMVAVKQNDEIIYILYCHNINKKIKD